MFERDKEELRELGVPLETGTERRVPTTTSRATASPAATTSCPRSTLEPDEAAALGLAARLWQSAPAGRRHRLARCSSCGPPASTRRRRAGRPRAAGRRERAGLRRLPARPSGTARRSRFTYRTPRRARPRPSATSSRGASCPGAAAGTSSATTPTARAERVFRMSRIVGDGPGRAGAAGAVAAARGPGPAGDGRAAWPTEEPRKTARVQPAPRRRLGAAPRGDGHRRRPRPAGLGRSSTSASPTPSGFADRVTGYGADAVVLSPARGARRRRAPAARARRPS